MLTPLSSDFNILCYIIRKFYRGISNYEFKPENMEEMTWSKQEDFLNATLKNSLLEKYPVNSNFARLFLKKLIQYLEAGNEIHDDLYTYLCLKMKSNNNESFSYRHYIIGNDLINIVTLKETNNIVVNGTTGMRTWEAALMLADWALCNSEVFRNKKVLELGSGVGFTGITLAKFSQTRSIILSDCHEDVLNAIESNISINFPNWERENTTDVSLFRNPDQIIGAINLDWNDISNLPAEICPDVIIGADIIYDPTILRPLSNVLNFFLKKNKRLEIFIAGVIRNEDTFNLFLQLLDSLDLAYIKLDQNENVYLEWDHKIPKYLLKINKKL